MTDTRVLLLHGMSPRNPSHWLWPLAEQLRERRIPVQLPLLPQCGAPSFEAWRDVALQELEMLGDGDRVVVAHSLGTVLWSLLAAELPDRLKVSRALLVAPPTPRELVHSVASFRCDDDVMGAGARAGAGAVTVVGREVDPHRTQSLEQLTRGWGVDVHELPGSGHLNPADGHGPWAWPLEWVLGSSAAPALGGGAFSLHA
ncbi:alpha/beta fold hydrolase [Demequina capsici]|uniref:Alpha/beta fold hydrolase n=1 Tax=Demequina capsici TaxID=3075620 RepID=A0AA96FHM4_9MICO|nr:MULTISPECIES: alpha/beta hydrolase [unclassified Demequina]WNM25865.1 alpha/beta fold hydrolase [Demequina sp. OYTSA14]WNM28760.1 alpha/beta fold hydrolase [Demequina sp. PMTSA13]